MLMLPKLGRFEDPTRTASWHCSTIHPRTLGLDKPGIGLSPTLFGSTVFGKHCECNAQKCTHLKRLPPLGSHLLLLSHCVLTKHEGQKNHITTAGNRTMNMPEREHASANYDKVTRMKSKPDESSSQHARCRLIKVQITTARPYESCKILKGRPRGNVFSKLVYYQYKSFPADRSVRRKSKNQLGWVINPVPHNLVRRIRFWRIKISSTWFYIFVLDKK